MIIKYRLSLNLTSSRNSSDIGYQKNINNFSKCTSKVKDIWWKSNESIYLPNIHKKLLNQPTSTACSEEKNALIHFNKRWNGVTGIEFILNNGKKNFSERIGYIFCFLLFILIHTPIVPHLTKNNNCSSHFFHTINFLKFLNMFRLNLMKLVVFLFDSEMIYLQLEICKKWNE